MRDDPAEAVRVYRKYESNRRSTYMTYAEPGGLETSGERTLGEGSAGYAGVALDIIEALVGGPTRRLAANVPHDGALVDLEPTDVAEISVTVDSSGVSPVSIGGVPPLQRGLMQQVKLCERLAVRAILNRTRDDAVRALMAHPLVLSYSRSTALVDDYLSSNRALTEEWT